SGLVAVDKEIKYWLALGRVKGLELFFLKGLFDRFGGPEGIFNAGKAELGSFSTALAENVEAFKEWDRVEREIELIEEKGARVITYNDPDYPAPLKEICDPPCLLYAKGSGYDGSLPAVAVVGTRHPTHYGLKMSEVLARDLSSMGVVVVSGMARGCDTAAHKGALSSGGMTVAVLGTGVDVPYPRENKRLYGEIAEKGLVITELPMSTPPAPYNFPKRNRVISGLSAGVVVVEAPLRSGALMTARLALEYNREVLSVPGQATSYKSAGTNRLLKEGAFLVENAEDVMAALSLVYAPRKSEAAPELNDEERLMWKALGEVPLHIDAIALSAGVPVMKASATLMEMELKGLVRQQPGKRFSRGF
ncbi:MAG: DNA-protecting protein DprA, partial [Deltaproteobacteria bacterium]|nr:DNA-protecting protein DprA [Deltaproteobacteria bacterium]